ncbi:TPA: hypothetical protein MIX25_16555 [Klebsiella pneumoniae]|nr:hypothetical protein D0883_08815 [Klebsiella pneumoniae]OXU72871.1 hypothetical protein CEB43_17150 [Klebsiella pneumoniae subsp. pneumoniae]OVW60996.1 hypothetical protein BME48_00205 [Klebsiella pneumoniae]OYE79121.1 hypothetical protein CI624_20135 [Klebsiella pneumoniae subsp. pneumoniae]OYF03245.1 hypothetical protein CI625_06990 [Klebsiella pneumoniae subsp. pneumoniae]
MVVILVVLTASQFRFSLLISHLKAKAIPVRGAKFKNPAQGNLSGIFAFRDPLRSPSMQSYPGVGAIFLL